MTMFRRVTDTFKLRPGTFRSLAQIFPSDGEFHHHAAGQKRKASTIDSTCDAQTILEDRRFRLQGFNDALYNQKVKAYHRRVEKAPDLRAKIPLHKTIPAPNKAAKGFQDEATTHQRNDGPSLGMEANAADIIASTNTAYPSPTPATQPSQSANATENIDITAERYTFSVAALRRNNVSINALKNRSRTTLLRAEKHSWLRNKEQRISQRYQKVEDELDDIAEKLKPQKKVIPGKQLSPRGVSHVAALREEYKAIVKKLRECCTMTRGYRRRGEARRDAVEAELAGIMKQLEPTERSWSPLLTSRGKKHVAALKKELGELEDGWRECQKLKRVGVRLDEEEEAEAMEKLAGESWSLRNENVKLVGIVSSSRIGTGIAETIID